jgi:serine/threonine protein kinase
MSIEDYEIGEDISVGSFGSVKKAKRKKDNTEVAIKYLEFDEDSKDNIINEVKKK